MNGLITFKVTHEFTRIKAARYLVRPSRLYYCGLTNLHECKSVEIRYKSVKNLPNVMDWNEANDIRKRLNKLISSLGFSHIDSKRIFCFRSFGSRSKARARIWSLPKIWQKALSANPAYCIEVISERFDELTEEAKNKVLIHELLHIPKNFSGSLLSHKGRGRRIDTKTVERLYQKLRNG